MNRRVSPSSSSRSTGGFRASAHFRALAVGATLGLSTGLVSTAARADPPPPATSSAAPASGIDAAAVAPAAAPTPTPTPATAAPSDAEFDEHLRRAASLMRDERFQEALDEWNAAYQLKQRPSLLFERARAHQRLGDIRDAVTLYRSYLTAEIDLPAASKVEAEQALARLEALLPERRQQLAGLSLQPGVLGGGYRPLIVRKPDVRLVASGGVLLGVSYAAAVAGGILISLDRSRYVAGALPLIVPIAGPLLSGIIYPATNGSESVLYWSLPWMLVDGAAQVTGLILIITGHKFKRPVLQLLTAERLHVTPYSTRDGGGMVFSGTF